VLRWFNDAFAHMPTWLGSLVAGAVTFVSMAALLAVSAELHPLAGAAICGCGIALISLVAKQPSTSEGTLSRKPRRDVPRLQRLLWFRAYYLRVLPMFATSFALLQLFLPLWRAGAVTLLPWALAFTVLNLETRLHQRRLRPRGLRP
jgi:hypothetical protein